MSTVDTAEDLIADISKRIDDAISQLRPVYLTTKEFAFWHDVGLTGLGATATVLAGSQAFFDAGSSWQNLVRFLVLVLTGLVTVFAACNQFFQFKSRANTCHLALRSIYDVRDELELIRAGAGQMTEDQAVALRRAIQKGIKDADLPSSWRMFGPSQDRQNPRA
jgi:hypothetical protein